MQPIGKLMNKRRIDLESEVWLAAEAEKQEGNREIEEDRTESKRVIQV